MAGGMATGPVTLPGACKIVERLPMKARNNVEEVSNYTIDVRHNPTIYIVI